MKIAVIMSGQIRSSYKYIDEIYNVYDDKQVDYYFNTYPDEGLDIILSKFRPKVTILEDMYNLPSINISPLSINKPLEQNVVNFYHMWRKRKSIFNLIDNNYDAVLCTRFDRIYPFKFDYTMLDKKTYFIPQGNDWRGGLNDQFCYASYKDMKYYFSMIDNIETYLKEGVMFHSETLMARHLKDCKVQRIDFSFRTHEGMAVSHLA